MANLNTLPDMGPGVLVADALTTLPFPPVTSGDVSDWNSDSVVGIFDLEVHAAAPVNLTLATLYGGSEIDISISNDVDAVDFANDELDIIIHSLETGDGPLQLTTTNTLPNGLSLLTDYYVIKVNAGTIQLATSFANALAGTFVAINGSGTGTHTLTGTASQKRVKWLSYGLLGHASDGALSLTEKAGFTTRVRHRPRTKYYAISATLSAGVATTVSIHAVQG